MFDRLEVLVSAKDLLALAGVDIATDCARVTYYHILFDKHEIIFANGVPSESLHLGSEAIKSMNFAAIEELCAIFKTDPIALSQMASKPARHFVAGNRARTLAYRHAKNAKPMTTSGRRHIDHIGTEGNLHI